MRSRAEYPPLQFAGFRIAIGVYLTVYFTSLSLYARELLSVEGVVPDVRLNLTQVPFPDVLVAAGTSAAASAFSGLAVAAAVLLTVGFLRCPAAAVLQRLVRCGQ